MLGRREGATSSSVAVAHLAAEMRFAAARSLARSLPAASAELKRALGAVAAPDLLVLSTNLAIDDGAESLASEFPAGLSDILAHRQDAREGAFCCQPCCRRWPHPFTYTRRRKI